MVVHPTSSYAIQNVLYALIYFQYFFRRYLMHRVILFKQIGLCQHMVSYFNIKGNKSKMQVINTTNTKKI